MELLYDLFNYGMLIYAIALLCWCFFLGVFAIAETLTYLRKSRLTDYNLLASSPNAPTVSILAPAYNEGANIIENVRSLLNIYYNHLELIVINDGSKDDSMARLIAAYQLEPVQISYHPRLSTKPVKAIYKSTNPVYSKLLVIDKENGGKADALNTGINLASHQYLVCIDVDCILEQDALLKLVKPFMEESNQKVIATGGVVRIANSCVFENGKLVEINLPRQFLPRFQALEYIRAFLLGRMAWSRLNGLLLISGAFGAFDRQVATAAGGYDHNTVGEDMELVVRMRRYMADRGLPYKVTFIPDPLCWTEAPATYQILGRQRNRWMRGSIETLKKHRALFFNPRYGLLGLLSYPYWFFFEFLAPVIEFAGLLIFIVLAMQGLINWPFFLGITAFILIFGWLFSVFAILMEVATFNQYKKRGEVGWLIVTALLEPFLFHPFLVWSSIRGIVDLLRKRNSWGEMTRQGFASPGLSPEIKPGAGSWLRTALAGYAPLAAGLLLFWLGLRAADFLYTGLSLSFPEKPAAVFGIAVLNDLALLLPFSLALALLYGLLALVRERLARAITLTAMALATLLSLGLMQYFRTALVPLGADIHSYTWQDLRQTIGASGEVNAGNAMVLAGAALAFLATFRWLSPLLARPARRICLTAALVAAGWLVAGLFPGLEPRIDQEYARNLAQNKLAYFLAANYDYLYPAAADDPALPTDLDSNIRYVQEQQYPFLRRDETPDVLSSFFKPAATPPNIVIIVVEGLGRSFSQDNAYLGSFTPFLDSLSGHSLYWENFLSNSGRTFTALPSLLGSLPFGETGFNELAPMPRHLSLISLLKANGYHTSFYYGGDASFDNMDAFLREQKTDNLFDIRSFPRDYPQLPAVNGFSWGYGDKELYRHLGATAPMTNPGGKPSLQVVLTVASHNPFQVNDQDYYDQQFEQRMQALGFSEKEKQQRRPYSRQLASVLYADDALRAFIRASRTQPGFENTIFLITGDHRIPEIPLATKIDRYHVPLIIYSPLLKRSARFASVSSHADITPTLLAYLKTRFKLSIPAEASWLGMGIDTARTFRNIHQIALKQTKTDLLDFVSGEYHLNGQQVYKLKVGLDEELIVDPDRKARLQAGFARFKHKNKQITARGKLIPDSLYQRYFPR
jgi:cellulose synthase/poly-beta-1,6-N-acetylglucosamine synthase-like glycosyltransferase/phosphoglycerol transferase MdoB-like AlkP superfamily enzyme